MNKKNEKSYLLVLLLIIFIILLIFSSIKIIKYILDSNDNEEIIEDISTSIQRDENNTENDTDDNKYQIDFETLKHTNPDTIGFLKVNGTDIESIIVKTTDNNYYLNHNFEKKENSAGWIFADYRNKLDGTDKNIIIYGHNMRNGTMFASLKNILNKEWYQTIENRYVTFITAEETCIYEVFSIYQIESEEYYTQTDFNNLEFISFIDTLKKRSQFNFNVGVSQNDKILTLSTCANNNRYRVVLHAKKINT